MKKYLFFLSCLFWACNTLGLSSETALPTDPAPAGTTDSVAVSSGEIPTLLRVKSVVRDYPTTTFKADLHLPTQEKRKFGAAVGNFLAGEALLAAISSIGFAKNGAFYIGAAMHFMSLASFNGGKWYENDKTPIVAYGLTNAYALHNYFVEPSSGAPVFWRSFIGMNTIVLTAHVVDKAITRKKKKATALSF